MRSAAISAYQLAGKNFVDTQLTLRPLNMTPRTGKFKVKSQCGEWAYYNGSRQMAKHCPNTVTFSMHRLSDNMLLSEQTVEGINSNEFIAEFEHLVQETVVITASYDGAIVEVDDVTTEYSPAQVSIEIALTCNPTHEDLDVDGVDQDCNGVDGLDSDGDGYASVTVGGDDCDDQEASVYPAAVDLFGDGIDQSCSGV